MKVLRVRHHDASVTVSFKLNRFIDDWPSAQQRFISGITNGFHDWHPISSRNFTLTPAFALQDLRCKCQLFGGACSLVLAPEALQLEFENVTTRVQPVVLETIRRASEWFVGALGDHGRDWSSFHTLTHMEALDADAVDAYLGQFLPAEADELAETEPRVKYLPSSRTVLSGEQEGWLLQRVVEKSGLIENGVFVDTRIEIQSSDLGIDDLMQLLARIRRLADRAVGLDCEEV